MCKMHAVIYGYALIKYIVECFVLSPLGFCFLEGPTLIEQLDLDDSGTFLSQSTDSRLQKKKMTWASSSSNTTQIKNSAAPEVFPFMDHWNAQTQKVSLREIICEEIALQEKQDLV